MKHYLGSFPWRVASIRVGLATLALLTLLGSSLTASPPSYLSDTDAAYALLEAEQHRLLSIWNFPNSRTVDWDDWEHLDKIASSRGISKQELVKTLEDIKKIPLPTREEDPVEYYKLRKYVERLRKTTETLPPAWQVNWKFGTLPSPDLNARTIRVPHSSESIVAFHRLLDLFAHEIAKTTVLTLDVSKNGDTKFSDQIAQERLQSNPAILQNFVNIIVSFALVRPFPTKILSPKRYDPYVKNLRDAMLLFVLGHEHAHVALNHSALKSTPAKLVRSWNQEFEADINGMRLMAATIELEYDPGLVDLTEFAKSGAMFFLRAMDLVDRARSILCKRELPEKSEDAARLVDVTKQAFSVGSDLKPLAEWNGVAGHPPFWMRAMLADVEWAELKPDKITPIEQGTHDLGKKLVDRLEILWGLGLPEIRSKLENIKGPHPACIGT